jgi:hypothetical protein
VPADFYERSERLLPAPSWGKDFTYPDDFELVRVRKAGTLHWNGRSTLISSALRHELLGLQHRNNRWRIYFGPLLLGSLSTTRRKIFFHRKGQDRHRQT